MSKLIRILNDYRQVVRAVRSAELLGKVSEVVHRCPMESGVVAPSICDLVGDKNRLMPLVSSLPHLRLADGWRLDAAVKGSRVASHADFYVTDGVRELSPFDRIRLNGSSESIWEAYLLSAWCDVFFLGRHAGYGDRRIVTSYQTIGVETAELDVRGDHAIVQMGDAGHSMERWNFAPTVHSCGLIGLVTSCHFAPFGGFAKCREIFWLRPFRRIAVKRLAEAPYQPNFIY